MRIPLSLILLLSLTAHVQISAANEPPSAYTTTVWEPVDIVFRAELGEAPPLNVEFAATLTHSSGQTVQIPGFWDGENRFVLRFSPPTEGTWTYTTASDLAALDDQRGTVSAGPPANGQPGPIGLDTEDPRRFVYANGDRYFPLAFEIDWLFALDAENAEGIPKTRQLLDYVSRKGFNQVVMNVFAYDVNWPRDPNLPDKYDYSKPRVFPFAGDNTNPDFSTLNIEFFQRFDRVVRELDRQGIAAHIMIYVWNKQVAWPESESEADNLYFDYVVKRYQAFPHLIWDISKEATGYGRNDRSYITRRIERLRALDGHKRLVTVHDHGYCSAFPETVDFISVQNWQSETWHIMRKIREKHPKMAIFNIEHGGYEEGPYHVFSGNYYRPEVNLERAYHIVFAGAYPTHYWQDAAWSVVIHDIEALPEDDQPKLDYYRHMADFFEKYDLTRLEPATGKANSGFCLTNNKDLFVYLVPKENDLIIPRPPREGFEQMQITWFDPFTGEYQEQATASMVQWNRVSVPNPGRMKLMIMKMIPAS
ncbi:MAG: DUF5060 domain-containing protein [Verrucomicrobiota bacterium]